jgi:hypothetical protein
VAVAEALVLVTTNCLSMVVVVWAVGHVYRVVSVLAVSADGPDSRFSVKAIMKSQMLLNQRY